MKPESASERIGMAEIEYIVARELKTHEPVLTGCHITGCAGCSFAPLMWHSSKSEWDQWIEHLPRFAGQGALVQLNADDKELKKLRIKVEEE